MALKKELSSVKTVVTASAVLEALKTNNTVDKDPKLIHRSLP